MFSAVCCGQPPRSTGDEKTDDGCCSICGLVLPCQLPGLGHPGDPPVAAWLATMLFGDDPVVSVNPDSPV